ncbi:uncharacterized protein LOC62_06G007845 [Vanrija pseudolonga]|uniref:Uncharacterized protein n=1 Tax=Vanrija pseudolonga TaxID=143232 RepID=A0AAF1BK74_9TREE|nr:hypothetical protein LOC62_06G007845 [Vanrija pseudolonga]
MRYTLAALTLAAALAAAQSSDSDTFTRSLTTIPGGATPSASTFEYGPPIWPNTKGATTINGTPFPVDGTSTTSIADLTGTPGPSSSATAGTSVTTTTATAPGGGQATSTHSETPLPSSSSHSSSSSSAAAPAPAASSSHAPSAAPNATQCSRLSGTLLALGLFCAAAVVVA